MHDMVQFKGNIALVRYSTFKPRELNTPYSCSDAHDVSKCMHLSASVHSKKECKQVWCYLWAVPYIQLPKKEYLSSCHLKIYLNTEVTICLIEP